jgi:transketolase
LAAAKYKADEMCIIVDYNKIQLDGHSDDILPLGSLKAKFKSFDCHVLECDGHDIDALSMAINESLNLKDRPSVILAHTIKGKGVSFMENNPAWHGKPVSDDDRERALAELK